ncbi:nitroreductase/quinone reductase family protein [Catenulispora rubra]|uniref:nitroreductase/quinone reductase family protein n=1 Tax=Catenulispora rubra TaxID=280293 RepID=UPI001E59677A|nr:nitroreductase/quinone reductase family protein [Catenulispora rubra]
MTMSSEEWDRKAAAVTAEFRANAGVVGGEFEGYPLLILHTTDDDGSSRSNVVMYRTDGDRRIVFASHSGLPYHPVWYGNLRARPVIAIEVGAGTETVRAVELGGEERDRLYELQAADYPDFAVYRTRTNRRIPVLALMRETGAVTTEPAQRV